MKAGCLTAVMVFAIMASIITRMLADGGSESGGLMGQFGEVILVILLGMGGVTAISFLGMILFVPAAAAEESDQDHDEHHSPR